MTPVVVWPMWRQGLRNGKMPRILGKDDLFEEHGADDAREVFLEYYC